MLPFELAPTDCAPVKKSLRVADHGQPCTYRSHGSAALPMASLDILNRVEDLPVLSSESRSLDRSGEGLRSCSDRARTCPPDVPVADDDLVFLLVSRNLDRLTSVAERWRAASEDTSPDSRLLRRYDYTLHITTGSAAPGGGQRRVAATPTGRHLRLRGCLSVTRSLRAGTRPACASPAASSRPATAATGCRTSR